MPEHYVLTMPLLFAIQILSGIALSGVSIASTNIALKHSPPRSAHVYMTAYGISGAVTGAVAPIVGGVLATFFAVRELAISISWAEPTRTMSMYALNFRALDFLFLIAFFVGLYALHRLSRVQEEGHVTEGEVKKQLILEVTAPIKRILGVPGLRHLIEIPEFLVDIIVRHRNNNKDKQSSKTN